MLSKSECFTYSSLKLLYNIVSKMALGSEFDVSVEQAELHFKGTLIKATHHCGQCLWVGGGVAFLLPTQIS